MAALVRSLKDVTRRKKRETSISEALADVDGDCEIEIEQTSAPPEEPVKPDEPQIQPAQPGGEGIIVENILYNQQLVRDLYDGKVCQISVAILIVINFVINAAEKQVDPGVGEDIFAALELAFTIIFCVELAFNMYAYWIKPFFSISWNIFDFLVVAVSVLSTTLDGLPGISTLRLLRAFRVFRLFKRLKSLQKILLGLEAAIPGCSNAFLILILVSSIYSILAVEFFSEIAPEFFKTFAGALFTMFQILTSDNWSEIAWPIVDVYPVSGIFFFTYIMIANVVLVNVVIAVILDEMAKTERANPAMADIQLSPEDLAAKQEQEMQIRQLELELEKSKKQLEEGMNPFYRTMLELLRETQSEVKTSMNEIRSNLQSLENEWVCNQFSSTEKRRNFDEDYLDSDDDLDDSDKDQSAGEDSGDSSDLDAL
ncbi:hypothetical protein CYMTET_4434 [Cymbomonas tetramitiformis]|uniref:Ion transport domain-containing protein n=1 Tax=Cymbomonas tetramitiformis TaxID=36881 RepID=A0AAE0LKE3_9CHLO|nr:hypothetical protein CYMTET_4434 [Cymbomonas tetramitiformis]|eukprot:gene1148-1717_t